MSTRDTSIGVSIGVLEGTRYACIEKNHEVDFVMTYEGTLELIARLQQAAAHLKAYQPS